MGGTAISEALAPGDTAKITADANSDNDKFMIWKSSSNAIDIGIPTNRSISFTMP